MMTNFETRLLCKGRRFWHGDDIGKIFVLVSIVDQNLANEVRKGHRERMNSGYKKSPERSQPEIQHEEVEDEGPS